MNQITELKNDQEILFDDFNNLGNYYELSNKEEIFDFLDEHPYLVFDLYNAYPFIRKYFKTYRLYKLYSSRPEEGREYGKTYCKAACKQITPSTNGLQAELTY